MYFPDYTLTEVFICRSDGNPQMLQQHKETHEWSLRNHRGGMTPMKNLDSFLSEGDLHTAKEHLCFETVNDKYVPDENLEFFIMNGLPKSNDAGFLSPNGKFIPVSYHTHENVAQILFGVSDQTLNDDGYLRIKTAEEKDFKMAWINGSGFADNITSEQKQALQNIGRLKSDQYFRSFDVTYDISFPKGNKILPFIQKERERYKPKSITRDEALNVIRRQGLKL